MIVDEHELSGSRFHQEFLKPQGNHDSIGISVLRTEQRMGWWAAHRFGVSRVTETLSCAS